MGFTRTISWLSRNAHNHVVWRLDAGGLQNPIQGLLRCIKLLADIGILGIDDSCANPLLLAVHEIHTTSPFWGVVTRYLGSSCLLCQRYNSVMFGGRGGLSVSRER